MSLVGEQFPDVNVKAINFDGEETIVNLSKPGMKKLLFWYPKDFTFVCPTEIHAFQEKLEEFAKRGVQVYGASCDTLEVHMAWLDTPKDQGGIQGVTYPIISDSRRELSKELKILDYETEFFWDDDVGDQTKKVIRDGDNVTYRATYLIDETGRVFHESVNDMPLGRNVDEYLRIIDAKLFNEEKGDVCPANWEAGKDGMSATRDGVSDYLSKN
jgi:peroxiredoxin (alkyl hydroperoxide reductase subunit C)